jgi:amidase
MWPLIGEHGDEGIRRAVGLMLDAHQVQDGAAYMKALAERSRLVREWQRFFDAVPLVLAPICSEPVYARGFDLESAERTALLWRECATLTAVPVMGVPGLAVPTGIVDGLPTGVQILAARFREDLCLAAAEVIETRAGVTPRLPVDIQW